jgi:Ca2+-binding RTX toxin-like protein
VGNTAADWLFGGSGRDRLEGQGGNDALDGGPAIDVCRQGVGSGRRVRCELPKPPEPKTLVIAYSDINNNAASSPPYRTHTTPRAVTCRTVAARGGGRRQAASMAHSVAWRRARASDDPGGH